MPDEDSVIDNLTQAELIERDYPDMPLAWKADWLQLTDTLSELREALNHSQDALAACRRANIQLLDNQLKKTANYNALRTLNHLVDTLVARVVAEPDSLKRWFDDFLLSRSWLSPLVEEEVPYEGER